MKPKFSSRLALAFCAATGLVAWNARSNRNEAQAAKPSLPLAPEFVGDASQWLGTNGKSVTLSARSGKVTIVGFSASQDTHLPTFQKWATKWQQRGVAVVDVYSPKPESRQNPDAKPKPKTTAFAENGWSFPILLDQDNANWNRWKPKVSPTIFVVDGQGKTRFKSEDLKETGAVEKQVEAILAETATPGKIMKSDQQWKTELSPMAYKVLRQAGTEAPYSGALWDNHEAGTYTCAGCGLELFSSDTKFESGTGWPSFYQAQSPKAVEEKTDTSFGSVRTEVLCARCGGHLGHVFDDGPKPTGLRYCMNSAALAFEKK